MDLGGFFSSGFSFLIVDMAHLFLFFVLEMLHGNFKAIDMVISMQWHKNNGIKKGYEFYSIAIVFFFFTRIGVLHDLFSIGKVQRFSFPKFFYFKNIYLLSCLYYFHVIWHERNYVTKSLFCTKMTLRPIEFYRCMPFYFIKLKCCKRINLFIINSFRCSIYGPEI